MAISGGRVRKLTAHFPAYGMTMSFPDSIRGLSAIIVLTAHLHASSKEATGFRELPILRIFDAAGAAVRCSSC